METIKTPWFPLAKSILILCALPITIISILLNKRFEGSYALLANSVLWSSIGGFCFFRGLYLKKQLDALKSVENTYHAEVVDIIPSKNVHIGSYVTAKVECVYYDRFSKRCLIKSGYHLLRPHDNLDNIYAKAYVDSNDPTNYYVELFRIKVNTSANVDYDYR